MRLGLPRSSWRNIWGVSKSSISKWETGLNYPDLSLFQPLALALDTSVAELLGVEIDIPDDTINAMVQISKQEKRQLLNKVREYFSLTICLGIAVIAYKIYLTIYGYAWEKINSQFWMEGILIALSITLITNGAYLLMKYKNYFQLMIDKIYMYYCLLIIPIDENFILYC